MTDWSQRYDDASDEVDAFLREKGIELPEEEDGDKSPAYNNSARRMLFSGDYSNDAKKKLEGAQCPNPMNNSGCTGTEDLTLDHTPSVSHYFNSVGWQESREERNRWYTDTENLQVLCRSCNALKGGEPFDKRKVAECLRAGRG